MIHYVKIWLIGLAIFTLIDMIWLGYVAAGFYRAQMHDLLDITDGKMNVNIPAAILTWAVIVAGIIIFVTTRLPQEATYWHALGWGALFGVTIYAVYDLTNLAVLKNYPVLVTVVDIAWGGVICGVTSVLLMFLDKKLA